MIGFRIQRFLQAWREEDARTQVFLAWNAGNTLGAFALLLSSFFLIGITSAPGSQQPILLGYIVVAAAWLVSIFAIGPVYERAVADEESA